MIRVRELSKSFGSQKVLDRMSLDVRQGEIVSVMGPSGTGKSVLLFHLIGLMAPDEGSIMVDNEDLLGMTEDQLLVFRRKIGFLFQDSALYDFMTVAENLAFPLSEHTEMSHREIHARVGEFLTYVDMPEAAEKFPSQLSGGMRKRAALARAMILGTKVLLCDEPTSGLDPVRSRDISLLIRQLSKKLNCTTVITTHDVVNAFRTADRAIVINEGKAAAEGTEEELRRSADPFVKDFLRG